jgi:carotenoid cleavage dioxygenase
MVHGVRLADGSADWYRNRWVRAGGVIEALGVPDPGGEIHSGMDFAANTNVIGHAGKTLAIVEAGGRPIELSYELDTLRRGDFDGTLPNGFTAHPKRDPDTGELHAVCYWWGLGNQVQYIVVDTAGKVTKVVPIETTGAPMLHDMGLSERYALVLDLPCVFDLELASAVRFPYKWDESYPARVGVLPRDGGNDDVKWFEIEPCYIFHPMNTFDDGDRVVFDAVRHPKMFATELNGPNEGRPTLNRWTFDLSNGKVVEERLDDRGQEFPRHDERLIGKPYRYGYALASDPGLVARGILKHDLHTGTKVEHDFGAGTHAAEPVFVPSSDDAAEDDGYVMTFVYDENTDRSDLVILHAQDFAGDPVASVHLPQRVPFGFHGNWVPDPS